MSLREGEDDGAGIFLVGAYQEILGDMHNLFGDTDSVNIYQNDDINLTTPASIPTTPSRNMLRRRAPVAEELMTHYRDKVASADLNSGERSQFLDALRWG